MRTAANEWAIGRLDANISPQATFFKKSDARLKEWPILERISTTGQAPNCLGRRFCPRLLTQLKNASPSVPDDAPQLNAEAMSFRHWFR
jgi:hypothetical protein